MSNVRQLPDAYKQDGNHKKMLEINEQARDDLRRDMQDVLDCLDIDIATGKTLDLIGEIVNQKRGELNDVQYRTMIRFKVAKYLSQGDYNSVMQLIVFLFKCNNGDFIMQDIGNATVEIKSLPLAEMIKAGFTSEQTLKLIEELLPAGVRISGANFVGTFVLSDDVEESADEGFADIDGTIGGHLGLVLVDEEAQFELPT